MRLVVVSNRLPAVLEGAGPGQPPRVVAGSGGLVSALRPVLQRSGGAWIGWPGAASEPPEVQTAVLAEFGRGEGYELRPVFLSAEEVRDFYSGSCNEIVWPLFHDLQSRCNFAPAYWASYRAVNHKFADAVATYTAPGDFIWVQDYHLMSLGASLRERGFRGAIGFFLHVPFPPPDIYCKLPWRVEILESLLRHDIVGFQTPRDLENFLDCLRRLLPQAARHTAQRLVEVEHAGETSVLGVFPIGIDYASFEATAKQQAVAERAQRIRADLSGQQVILGLDRLDYTKGIPDRLRAFHLALQRFPELHRKVTMLQVVVPSRESVPEYQDLKSLIERLVSQINGEFAAPGWTPVQYLFRSLDRDELVAYYRLADVALVTPLKDGMNLVAKEYCACQVDGNGVLILSEFAGAAVQLVAGAMVVNPYDLGRVAEAIRRAVMLSAEQRRPAMRRLRRIVRRADVFHWVERYLAAAARAETLRGRRRRGPTEEASRLRPAAPAAPAEGGEVLDQGLAALARTPILLVATDFDGTLAPIVDDPGRAVADEAATAVLGELSGLAQTHVAIVSGRSRGDLLTRAGNGLAHVRLIGSHGLESGTNGRPKDGGVAFDSLTGEQRDLLARLDAELSRLAATVPGAALERKPSSIAFHFRRVEEARRAEILAELQRGPASWSGVRVRPGKCVLELAVVEASKGRALDELRRRVGATAVLFAGDDVTDEDGFAALGPADLAIKVGAGDTRAAVRVGEKGALIGALERLRRARTDWLAAQSRDPIQNHSMLSDQRTVALLSPSGSVVWQCLPRLDATAVFAELLGGPEAGRFSIREVGASGPVTQRYVGDSLVVETVWPHLRVVDYLDCTAGRAFQRPGRTDLLRVLEGHGRARIEFAPRPDFGRIPVRIRRCPAGLDVEGVVDSLVLVAPDVRFEVNESGPSPTAVAEVELDGKPIVLELRHGTSSLEPARAPEDVRRLSTLRFWQGWASSLALPGLAGDAVRRSALLLKGLIHGPTGAIAAAATTSLPEQMGGVRNWDYRFCWPRDASIAAASLVRLGTTGPAIKFLDWVLGILDRGGRHKLPAPVYTVTGKHLTAEAELSQVDGYRHSRPIRISNAASHQIQLDVFGPIVELMAMLADRDAPLSQEHWRLLGAMIARVAERWQQPDHGIWEIRSACRHNVHTKVMCWLAVDRAVRIARYVGRPRDDWLDLRQHIAGDVLTYGVDPATGAFGAAYGEPSADAASLWIGLSGLLPADDPRFRATIDLVERELLEEATVFRYRYDDGLPGLEGGFNLCTAWLAQAYLRIGRRDDALRLFESYAAMAGPTGLLAEEWDPRAKEALGNVPQAYSHAGLIDLACLLGGAP